MPTLTHRQRVLTSFSHQQPDRVPLDMMGNATMLLDATYLRLRDHLGLSPIPPVRSGTTANYYDERILDLLDIDFRRIFLKKGPQGGSQTHPDGTFSDAWGIRYRYDGLYVNPVVHPLADAATVADVESYPWPTAEGLVSAEGLAETASRMFAETDYALVARNPTSLGFLERSSALMGMANFMMAMASAPDVAQALIDRQLEIYLGIYSIFLDAVGPYVQMVEFGDDFGSQQNLLISPAMFRTFIKPVMQQLFDLIHAKAPGAAIIHHTDGNIFRIIPDLIEVGVNVLNPVQTSARDMDGKRLKETFGDQLVFHGGLEHIAGPVDDAVAEVKERLATFAPGGGYVLASCNHMIDVPPENILAIFETARVS